MKIANREDFNRWLAGAEPLPRAHLRSLGIPPAGAEFMIAAGITVTDPKNKKRNRQLQSVRTRAAVQALHWHGRIIKHLAAGGDRFWLVVLGRELERSVKAFHDAAPSKRSAGITTGVLLELISAGMTAAVAREHLKSTDRVAHVDVEYEDGRFMFTDDDRRSDLQESAFAATYSRLKKKG